MRAQLVTAFVRQRRAADPTGAGSPAPPFRQRLQPDRNYRFRETAAEPDQGGLSTGRKDLHQTNKPA